MLCTGNLEIGKADIRGGVFQRDCLSPLVFVLGLTPLRLILGKVKAAYDFSKSKEMINHLLFKDNLRLFSRKERKNRPISPESSCF